MTAVDDRPTTEIGSRPQAQGGPPADHRAHPLDRQHRRCPGCSTSPWCAARSPTRASRAIDTAAGEGRARASSAVFTGKDVEDSTGRGLRTPGRSPPSRRPHATCRSPSTTSPAPARSSPSSRRAAPRPPGTPPSWSTSTTTSCRAVLDAREAARRRGARTPGPRHEQVRLLAARLGRARARGGDVDAAIDEAREDGILIEREYRQQRLIPAFMEPRSTVVDPTGEQMTIWSATQVPHILRFLIAATHGHPRVQGARHRPGRRAAGSAASCRPPPRSSRRWPSPAGSASRASTPRPARETMVSGHHGRDQWQKLTLAADQGRHGHRPEGRPARRHGRLRRPSSAAACRCSAP